MYCTQGLPRYTYRPTERGPPALHDKRRDQVLRPWIVMAEVLSPEMVQWSIGLILECSPKATIECRRAANETDFRPDMRSFTVPTLLLHGDNDQTAPLDLCGRRTAQAIPESELTVYAGAAHGLFLTHKDRLNDDLLAFILG